MATIAIQAAELSGETGLTLYVRNESGTLQNTGGDALSESPSSSGRFTATVAETLSGIMYCYIEDADGNVVRDGYLANGETTIQPGYPSSGGSGSDPLENAVPGSYSAGTAGYKIGLITAAAIATSSPVATDGTISEIVIGDDYKAANGRAFTWTITPDSGFVLATSTCTFGGKSPDGKYSWLVTGSITLSGSNWILSFDLPKTATASCVPGMYEWSVEVKDVSSNEVTKVRSRTTRTKLVAKQT